MRCSPTFEIDRGDETLDGGAHDQSRQLRLHDVEVAAQVAQLAVNVGKEPIAQIRLPLAAGGLNGMQASVVGELVRDFVTLLFRGRAAGDEAFAARGGAREFDEHVLDLRQRALVRQRVLLERDLVLLQLGDRLIELRFLLDHGQRKVRVAQFDERLTGFSRDRPARRVRDRRGRRRWHRCTESRAARPGHAAE